MTVFEILKQKRIVFISFFCTFVEFSDVVAVEFSDATAVESSSVSVMPAEENEMLLHCSLFDSEELMSMINVSE